MTNFPDKELIAELTSKMLLEVRAVHFRADEPFEDHHLGMARQAGVVRVNRQLPEHPAERHLSLDRDVLIAEKNDLMSGERVAHGPKQRRVDRLIEIDTMDDRADGRRAHVCVAHFWMQVSTVSLVHSSRPVKTGSSTALPWIRSIITEGAL